MTDKNTGELKSEEAGDPVVDVIVLQTENKKLAAKINELEFMNSAMGDQVRLNLMNHLMPYYLPKMANIKAAVDKCHAVADECVSVLEARFEKKTAEYIKRLNDIESGHEDGIQDEVQDD